MIELKNNYSGIKIDEIGAEVRAFECGGRAVLWNGDPNYWTGVSPLLFPICGGLMDDEFHYKEKKYKLEKHGFARFAKFKPGKITGNSAEFILHSTPETLAQYPFEFTLRVLYTLLENGYTVTCTVENETDGEMYFSIGSHEAYACPEGLENYDVIFAKPEDLNASVLNGNLLEYNTVPIIKNSDCLALKTEYFAVDALVFTKLKSRSAVLLNRVTGQKVQVEFPGKDYFLLWTKPGAGYICMEPWTGIPDFVDSTKDLTAKPGITRLEKGETYQISHKITVLA